MVKSVDYRQVRGLPLRVGLVVSIRMLLSVLIETSEPTSAEKP